MKDPKKYLITPRRADNNERLQMYVSTEDYRKVERGYQWMAYVTDLHTGKRWKLEGADCGSRGCFCDAIAREVGVTVH